MGAKIHIWTDARWDDRLLDDNGEKMSDTIGDMIDKLTIANIRLWMLEDARREYCNTWY